MSKTFPSGQTLDDWHRLHAAWLVTPEVQTFEAALAEHAPTLRHLGDAEAITALNAFANAWIARNGDLPDMGIREF